MKTPREHVGHDSYVFRGEPRIFRQSESVSVSLLVLSALGRSHDRGVVWATDEHFAGMSDVMTMVTLGMAGLTVVMAAVTTYGLQTAASSCCSPLAGIRAVFSSSMHIQPGDREPWPPYSCSPDVGRRQRRRHHDQRFGRRPIASLTFLAKILGELPDRRRQIPHDLDDRRVAGRGKPRRPRAPVCRSFWPSWHARRRRTAAADQATQPLSSRPLRRGRSTPRPTRSR